jgi:nicotinamide phosphoribosyltransferase
MNLAQEGLRTSTRIDGYKFDHRRQYPTCTEFVYSNWTPRMSRIEGQNEVVFFGLQYFLKKYMMAEWKKFFDAPVDEVCLKYLNRVNGYLGPNQIGTDHIRALHNLGYLPLKFRAVKEGSKVPLRVPMLTVENTDPNFAWLVNYFETIMSAILWLPCTSATSASRMRKLLNEKAASTGSPADFVCWQGHDFSFRGMAGLEAAEMSGAAHLLYFTGTDTVPALDFIDEYYTPPEGYFVGGSVAATEHSVMCAGGELSELETFDRLLTLYPNGVVSVVSDTWDLWKVLIQIIPTLKDKIMARNGKLVIRPDSGDPVKIICGDSDAPVNSPAYKGVVECLWDVFGGTMTSTGHRLLDQHIGCIYGDSITFDRAEAICNNLAKKGFASGNVVFGIGSFTYQYVTRDTFGFAMKATWVQINGKGMDIFKKPVTDNGMKNSAKGRLAVIPNAEGKLELISQATPDQEANSALKPVWVDGKFVFEEDFKTIRERALGDL